MTRWSAEKLRADGLVASDLAIARMTERFELPGSGDLAHVVEVTLAGGMRAEILPDRGFDIDATEVAGIQLSWTSPIADSSSLDRPPSSTRLASTGFRLGPDPASEIACTLGEAIANNSSRVMRGRMPTRQCGTVSRH